MNSPDNIKDDILDNESDSNHENHQSYVRKRTRASAEQLVILEDTFSVNVSPNSKLRKQLAGQLQMSERSIQIWFQNRRAKVKHMQKRAQVQMQQAAIRAQLYHYHQQQQQQYGMMARYGAATHIMPIQPSPYHYDQVAHQQQLYAAPQYMQRMPLPRAQSADNMSYYGYDSTANAARSYFLAPGPEPMMYKNAPSPDCSTAQCNYSHSTSENYLSNDHSIEITRQSMPPHRSSPHSFMSDTITPSQSNCNSVVDGPTQMMNDDYICNQISPSLTPTKEIFATGSPIIATDDLSENEKPAAIPEIDLWISTPDNEECSQSLGNNSPNVMNHSTSPGGFSSLTETINSCNSNTENDANTSRKESLKNQYLTATTLHISSWHRVKLDADDLVCAYEPDTDSFVWFITECGSRFKFVVSASDLTCIENTPPYIGDNGEPVSDMHFYMSHPPLFYMESTDETKEEQWIQCSDFTEDKQASRYLHHILKGGPHQLKQDLENVINKHEHLKRLVHFLQPNPHYIESNAQFLPSQQQYFTTVPSASYYPYGHYSNETSPISAHNMPNTSTFNTINSIPNQSPTLIMTSNEAACSSLYC